MSAALSFLGASLLAFGGMGALSFAMDRHHGDMTGRRDGPSEGTRRGSKVAGSVLLGLAAVLCLGHFGGSVGTALGLGSASVGALGVALGLSLAPKRVLPATVAAALSGLAVGAMQLAG